MSLVAAAAVGCVASVAESAPAATDAGAEQLVEIVVSVGTRVGTRTVADTAVPVDVFNREHLESVNSSDLIEVLNAIVPSFSVNREPISDGASFIRPTQLRGLDTHHTLVLVDGKRRHRAALMRLGGFGAHGPDIGSIPAIAIDSVEILRDGAAAQYGSDAIAGVINFKLKTDASGFLARARLGGYSQGDGEEATVEAGMGLALGDAGFVNVSVQVSESAPTSRSEPYDLGIGGSGHTPLEATRSETTRNGVTYYGPDAFTYTYASNGAILQVLPGSDGIPDDLDRRFAENFSRVGGDREFRSPAQIWGQPEREQTNLVANAAVPLGQAELYGFATYATKFLTGGFFYRRPGVSQLLPVRLGDGAIYDPRTSLYPAGFTPQFSGDVVDYAIHGGVRMERANGLTFDFSASRGQDEIRYTIANTMNPSMGPQTPTRFRPGNLVNGDSAVNADFTWPMRFGLASPVNIAVGLEYREEVYRIEAGDSASYEAGPFAKPDPFNFEITQAEADADPDDGLTVVECRIPGFESVGSPCPAGDPVNNAVPIGSNGFPGYPPAFSYELHRHSQAVYVDLEGDLTLGWLASLAFRYEDFSDFGNVGIWKLATRYRLTDNVNVRASFGTGFRAPTPGQLATSNVSTRVDPAGIPRAEGVFPSTHPAAALFGGVPLDPERSKSWTFGAATTPFDGLTLTADVYRIRLDDRIVLSSQFAVGPDEAADLERLGVPGASDIAQVRFFTNDVQTETSGADLVAAWNFDSPLGSTTLNAAVGVNRTRLLDRGRFVDAETEYDVERELPGTRAVMTATHAVGRFDVTLRTRYYGKYENTLDATLDTVQAFGSEIMVDVEATRTWRNRFSLKAGVQNLFDNYPDPGEFEVCCGRVYRRDSVIPWQGAMIYLQASWSSG